MKNEINIKIINKSGFDLPSYGTEGSAGFDIKAKIEENLIISPCETVIIPTGLYVELPIGYELQIRPRSGLAAKYEVTVLNSPGTIDSDYRGEIKIILKNTSTSKFVTIRNGDRIAQGVIAEYTKAIFTEVTELTDTVRGEGGLGHTGI